jgi:tetratricopeptide (TPR) repeat protein
MKKVMKKVMRKPTVLVICCQIFAACVPGEPPGSPEAVQAQAARLEEAGRWSEAAQLYRQEVLRGDPRTREAWVKKGILAYLMADQLRSAEDFTAEILRASPAYSEALFFLGDGQRILQHFEEARDTLNRLLRSSPDHASGRLLLAIVQSRLGNGRESLPFFEMHLQAVTDPRVRQDAQIEYSRALRQAGQPRRAADQLAELLEADPSKLPALAEAARTFHLLGQEMLARELRLQHQRPAECRRPGPPGLADRRPPPVSQGHRRARGSQRRGTARR